mmetsp:Transcript_10357/g.15922  ORF Transcript_10357/g.15922 Transcript_10357/m.15922 type:complete len:131 (-) Transcript_10357:1488-1880(-)
MHDEDSAKEALKCTKKKRRPKHLSSVSRADENSTGNQMPDLPIQTEVSSSETDVNASLESPCSMPSFLLDKSIYYNREESRNPKFFEGISLPAQTGISTFVDQSSYLEEPVKEKRRSMATSPVNAASLGQ